LQDVHSVYLQDTQFVGHERHVKLSAWKVFTGQVSTHEKVVFVVDVLVPTGNKVFLIRLNG